jgi:hypothetical protein
MLVENEYRVIGPPGCVSWDTMVSIYPDVSMPTRIDRLYKRINFRKEKWSTQCEIDGAIERMPICGAVYSGIKNTIKVTLACGKFIKLTPDHKILTDSGYVESGTLSVGDSVCINDGGKIGRSQVTSVVDAGADMTFDLTVGHPSGEGNFVANGIIVHNCGKTTYLADQVQKRVAKWCEDTGDSSMNCHDVLLASLTRTAAAEIRSRGLAIPSEQVGTLHAHALRALGKPKLCVSPKAIADWNRESPMEFWRSEGASVQAEDGISLGKYNGDALFAEYTTSRCRLTPRDEWRGPVAEFAKMYESWKYRNDYMDYDDLIIRAYEDDTNPPGNPSTILGDEQQDSSAAEFRLMRHWARKVNKLILVGDADQAVFSFRGGDPDGMFASEVPAEHEKVLEQSYRVPRAVHAEAMRVIERVSRRKHVVYYPRDEDGEVERAYWSMRTAPYEAVEAVLRLLDEPDERPGTPKAMFLFSCAYQANALMSALRSAGIPYWNPYARERGNFNPLHPAKGVSTLRRDLDLGAIPKLDRAVFVGGVAATWRKVRDQAPRFGDADGRNEGRRNPGSH